MINGEYYCDYVVDMVHGAVETVVEQGAQIKKKRSGNSEPDGSFGGYRDCHVLWAIPDRHPVVSTICHIFGRCVFSWKAESRFYMEPK